MNLDALTLDFGIFTGEYAITLGLVFLGWQMSRLIKVLHGEQVRHRRPTKDHPGRTTTTPLIESPCPECSADWVPNGAGTWAMHHATNCTQPSTPTTKETT